MSTATVERVARSKREDLPMTIGPILAFVIGFPDNHADELVKLADLKAQGIITEAEFAQQKAKLLA
ncbi:MAG TPA: SHOCT domain-containing protein [Jiangellaceae bacterium]|jgi:Short C-terminal domain|nr:SHOCT domain-containing protein [Jiangellaceae bacterium]